MQPVDCELNKLWVDRVLCTQQYSLPFPDISIWLFTALPTYKYISYKYVVYIWYTCGMYVCVCNTYHTNTWLGQWRVRFTWLIILFKSSIFLVIFLSICSIHTLGLCCLVYICLQLFYHLEKLTNQHISPFVTCKPFDLSYIFSDISIKLFLLSVFSSFYCYYLCEISFSALILSTNLYLKWPSFRQHIVRWFYFLIHSANLCLLIGGINPLKFKSTNKETVTLAILFVLCMSWRFFAFYSFYFSRLLCVIDFP